MEKNMPATVKKSTLHTVKGTSAICREARLRAFSTFMAQDSFQNWTRETNTENQSQMPERKTNSGAFSLCVRSGQLSALL